MCFSATASFSAAAVLIPAGTYCVKKSLGLQKPYWVFALLPLMFGIQQVFEGLVWMAIEPGGGGTIRSAALGFVFFSHLFWLIWIPLSCYIVESCTIKKNIFLVFIFLGAAHGLLMYIPLWFRVDWLTVELVSQSIDYKATLLYDEYIPRIVVRAFYAFIILVPLLLASDRSMKIFGGIIAASVAISTVFFGYAFISIWCYFAAVLSLYILVMILQNNRKALQAR